MLEIRVFKRDKTTNGVTLSGERKRALVDILFLLFVGTVIVTWFRGDYVLSCWDATFPWNPGRNLPAYSYTWHEERGMGIPNVTIHFLPYFAFMALFHNVLRLSLEYSQKALFYFLFVSSGLGMYFLVRTLNRKCSRLTTLASSLFYMFNPYSAIYLWRTFSTNMFSYSMVPFLLAFYTKAMRSKGSQDIVKNAILFGLASLFLVVAQPATDVMLLLLLFGCCYILLETPGRRLRVLMVSLAFALLWVSLNAWVLLPTLTRGGLELEMYAVEKPLETLEFNSRHTSALNVLRLVGQPELYSPLQNYGNPNTIYTEWLLQYRSIGFVCISFLMAFLAWFPLLRGSRDRCIVIFSTLAILGVIVVMGTQPPFGEIYSDLYLDFLPFSNLFRFPYLYFGSILAISYAYLVGSGIDRITNIQARPSLKKPMKVVSVFLLLLIVGLYMWPMWTGDVVPERARVRVPYYYLEAAEWLTQQEEDFAVFSLPQQTDVLQALRWDNGSYIGLNLLGVLTTKPVISEWTIPDYRQNALVRLLYQMFYRNDTRLMGKMLGALGVKYILIHNDIDSTFSVPHSLNTTKSILNRQEGVSLERVFGGLEFHRVQEFTPRIYVPAAPKLVYASIESPNGVKWECSRFEEGWVSSGVLTPQNDGGCKLAVESKGAYTYALITNTEPINVDSSEHPYLLVKFKTNEHSAILVSVTTNVRGEFLYAMNPTPRYSNNHYTIQDWYTLAFDVQALGGNVSKVDIFVTNQLETTYEGELELWIESIRFARAIGQPGDVLRIFSDVDFAPTTNAVLVAPGDFTAEQINLVESLVETAGNSNSTQLMSWKKIAPTKYVAHVNADTPYIVVLSQSYNDGWKACVDGEEIGCKFKVNLYQNGWYIDKKGSYDVIIEFTPQRYVELGRTITVITWAFLFIFYFLLKTKHPAGKEATLMEIPELGAFKSELPLKGPRNYSVILFGVFEASLLVAVFVFLTLGEETAEVVGVFGFLLLIGGVVFHLAQSIATKGKDLLTLLLESSWLLPLIYVASLLTAASAWLLGKEKVANAVAILGFFILAARVGAIVLATVRSRKSAQKSKTD